METTTHWKDRMDRVTFCKEVIGIGKAVRSFVEDKGHKNGPEIHTITDTGLIVVRNYYTKKFVTVLIARPGQIYRYYASRNLVAPKELMELARKHQDAGYNYK